LKGQSPHGWHGNTTNDGQRPVRIRGIAVPSVGINFLMPRTASVRIRGIAVPSVGIHVLDATGSLRRPRLLGV